MSKPRNSKKAAFLAALPTASIEAEEDILTTKCKFNFAYMDFGQPAGQSFEEWEHNQLCQLLNKLHMFSKNSLTYWSNQRIGAKNNKVLEIYGKFPANSDFKPPKHVPHQALWGRFRLEASVRLVGFVLPAEKHQQKHPQTGEFFDCNTFYVVFLDCNHRFYITNK